MKTKKILSAIMAMAMTASMIAVPVSASTTALGFRDDFESGTDLESLGWTHLPASDNSTLTAEIKDGILHLTGNAGSNEKPGIYKELNGETGITCQEGELLEVKFGYTENTKNASSSSVDLKFNIEDVTTTAYSQLIATMQAARLETYTGSGWGDFYYDPTAGGTNHANTTPNGQKVDVVAYFDLINKSGEWSIKADGQQLTSTNGYTYAINSVTTANPIKSIAFVARKRNDRPAIDFSIDYVSVRKVKKATITLDTTTENDGTQNILLNTDVDIDADSLTNIKLMAGNSEISGSVSYASNVITIDPTDTLLPGDYTVTGLTELTSNGAYLKDVNDGITVSVVRANPYDSVPVDLVAEGIANGDRLTTNNLFDGSGDETHGIWGEDLLSLLTEEGEYNAGKSVAWEKAWTEVTPENINTYTDIKTNTLTFNGMNYIITVPFDINSNTPSVRPDKKIIYTNDTQPENGEKHYNTIDIPDGYYNGISMLGGGYNNSNGIIFRYVYEDGTKSIWQHLWCRNLGTNVNCTESDFTDVGLDDYLEFNSYEGGNAGRNEIQRVYLQQMHNTGANKTKKTVSIDFIAQNASIWDATNRKYDYSGMPYYKNAENYKFQMVAMTMLQDGEAIAEELQAVYAKKPDPVMGTEKDNEWFESLKATYERAEANQNVNYQDLYEEVKAYIDAGLQPSESDTVNLYVSPDGSDDAYGTEAAPVKSLTEALKKAEEIETNTGKTRPVNIILADGEYEVTSTVDITGIAGAVTIKAAEGANPCLKGSKTVKISEMQDATSATNSRINANVTGVKSYSLADYTLADNICSGTESIDASNTFGVYVNGEIKPIAEYPNNDELVPDDAYASSNPGADQTITLTANEKFGTYKDTDGWYIEGYFKEKYRTYKVAKSNFTVGTDNALTFTNLKSSSVSGINRNWKIFNLLEELDVAGEWYVDKESKTLYYLPAEGETEIEISNMNNALVRVNQNNVTITGIGFRNTCRNAIEIADGVSDATISNCDFQAIGRNAITSESGASVTNTRIKGNTMQNIGYKGIYLNGGSLDTLAESGNVISENIISDPGKVIRSYAHAILVAGVGAEVMNNEISNTKSIALGFDGALNKIHHNKLTNVITEALDAGAIYGGRNLKYLGNEISYNEITLAERNGGNEVLAGIYLDDYLSGTIVHHNIIRNGTRGVFSNGGAQNKIYNNVYSGCTYGTSIRKNSTYTTWDATKAWPTDEAYTNKFTYLTNMSTDNWSGTGLAVYNNYGVRVSETNMIDSMDYTATPNAAFDADEQDKNVVAEVELEGLAKADIDTNYIGIKKDGLDDTIAYWKTSDKTVDVYVVSTYKDYKVVAAAYSSEGKLVGVKILDSTSGEFTASEVPATVKVIVLKDFDTMKPMTK